MKASDGLGFRISIQTNRTCYLLFEVFKRRLHHELWTNTQPRYVFKIPRRLAWGGILSKTTNQISSRQLSWSRNWYLQISQFSPEVSLIPRKRDLIKHTILSRESKLFRISWSRSKSWKFNSLYFRSVFSSRLSNWSQVFIVYNLIDHRNDVNYACSKQKWNHSAAPRSFTAKL